MSLQSFQTRVNLSSTGTAGDYCKVEAQATTHDLLLASKAGSNVLIDNPLYFKNSSDVSTSLASELDSMASDIAAKEDALTFDSVPVDSSTNPVESGGVYSALAGKQATIGDGDLTIARTANLQSSLDAKQDALTFDSAPVDSSSNVVESGGVFTALASKQDTIGDGDLSIASTANLQTALDAKAATSVTDDFETRITALEDLLKVLNNSNPGV
jgi:predicted nucleic acid-binding protein